MNLVLNVESVGLTPDQFYRLCSDNPELRLELTARKETVIMPPASPQSGAWNFNVTGQLFECVKRDGRGIGLDSLAGFTLPSGAVRAPDAAWVLRDKWDALTKKQRAKFAPVVRDFGAYNVCQGFSSALVNVHEEREGLLSDVSSRQEILKARVGTELS